MNLKQSMADNAAIFPRKKVWITLPVEVRTGGSGLGNSPQGLKPNWTY